MAITDYTRAYKAGEKEYRARLARGEYPYLPVLDEIVSHVEIDSQVPLGLVQIPIKSVVGTYSAGRTTAFAANFMPILGANSEFAQKWAQLYDELVEEGLRDPIKAYEYNNKFYVMEGNKRVSVFKCMDAVSIEANVTRLIPHKDEENETNRIYYEFLDFYDVTGINYLNMSREGNFKRLLHLTYDKEEKWTTDEELEFRAFFTFFENAFEPRREGNLKITAGDAVCQYLEVFGYEEVKDKSQAQITQEVNQFWNEFVAYDRGGEDRLVLNPTPESRKLAFSKWLSLSGGVTKVAFIHDKSAQESAWTYSHELGKKYVEGVFGDKISVSSVERVDGSEADDVFEAAIAAGNKVIFATSPKLGNAALRAAISHPDVIILNCSMNLSHKNVRAYYLRMYEAKFISGAIAGSMMRGGRIGYLSDYPIFGTTAEINAFALGVQMTNPEAKVILDWSQIKDHDPFDRFKEEKVRLISGRDMNARGAQGQVFGLYLYDEKEGNHTNLAMPVRHWGRLYEEIIRSVLRGSYKNDDNTYAEQALNYFWGMSAGVIDVICSRNLPAGQLRLMNLLRSGITNMTINPFSGPIISQDGVTRCEEGQEMPAAEVVKIDWLAENIDGYIPDISEMKEDAVELVEIEGIKGSVE